MVGNSLVNGAHQMRRLRVVDGETEFAFGIGFRVPRFFHALAEFEQDDFVSGGRFAGGAVLHGSGESFAGRKGGEEENGENEINSQIMNSQALALRGAGGAFFSRRAISASSVAASSCKEVFS